MLDIKIAYLGAILGRLFSMLKSNRVLVDHKSVVVEGKSVFVGRKSVVVQRKSVFVSF